MNRFGALLVLTISASSAACAVDPSGIADTDRVGSTSAALSADAAWPPKVDIPIGTKHDAVRAMKDEDPAGTFLAHLAQMKLKPVNVTDVSQWPRENGVPTCRGCFIPYATIHMPREPIAIVDSYAEEIRFVTDAPDQNPHHEVRFENVYARGAKLDWASTTIRAKNTDLRCSTYPAVVGARSLTTLTVTDAQNVDFSGGEGSLVLDGVSSNVRLTGAARGASVVTPITLAGELGDARLDGLENVPLTITGTMTGTTRFDRSVIPVISDGGKFVGGKLSTIGTKGTLLVSRGLTFDHVDLTDAGGDFRIRTQVPERITITPGTRWPVGSRTLFADKDLPSLKLAGVNLVTREAKWPVSSALNLDGLVLTGGSFPDDADLSGASLVGAELAWVRFTNQTLSRTVDGVVKGANFRRANLERASFGGKTIDGVDFSYADVRGASFDDANGSAKFHQAKGGTLPARTGVNTGDQRIDTSYARAMLGQSDFTEAQLQYASFSGASLPRADFTHAQTDFVHFDGASFVEDGIGNATLASAANMHGVDFSRADLRGVSLAGVDLGPLADENGGMERSSFQDAWMCGGDLSKATLGGANLSGLLIDVDGSVKLPDGSIGACAPGKHEGAVTFSAGGKDTTCPLHGGVPEDDGQCSAAQWRVPGAAANDDCSGVTTKKRNGFSCQKACECATDFCSGEGKCADR